MEFTTLHHESDLHIEVLFLSKTDNIRAQLAGYLLNHLGNGTFRAFRASMMPDTIHPLVARALHEVHIDSNTQPPALPEEAKSVERIDYVITLCDHSSASCRGREQGCPILPGRDPDACWGFIDPLHHTEGEHEAMIAAMRNLRDDIANRLRIWMPAALHFKKEQLKAAQQQANSV